MFKQENAFKVKIVYKVLMTNIVNSEELKDDNHLWSLLRRMNVQ